MKHVVFFVRSILDKLEEALVISIAHTSNLVGIDVEVQSRRLSVASVRRAQ